MQDPLDRTLFTTIQQTLQRHPAFASLRISASVSGGEVTLKGSVDTVSQARSIMETVQGIHGVASIRNKMMFKDGLARLVQVHRKPLSSGPDSYETRQHGEKKNNV